MGRLHPQLLPLVEEGALAAARHCRPMLPTLAGGLSVHIMPLRTLPACPYARHRAGTLVALERAAEYRERRSDGYQEPKLLYLVGTSHVSSRSAEDVRRVVQAVQPDAVVVELCRSRQAVMDEPRQQGSQQEQAQAALSLSSAGSSMSDGEEEPAGSSSATAASRGSNPLSLSGGSLLPAFQRSMELGGSSALLLRLVLGRVSARLSGRLGVRGGAEFVMAREEAEALSAQVRKWPALPCSCGSLLRCFLRRQLAVHAACPNASLVRGFHAPLYRLQLVLGDRPIEITLQRAWDALSWQQRGRLAQELAGGMLAAQQVHTLPAALSVVSIRTRRRQPLPPSGGMAGCARQLAFTACHTCPLLLDVAGCGGCRAPERR